MKKILAYLLTIAITATAAIGGTVAYLQDEDGAVNVMTTGNVYIEQHELQRGDGIDYKNGGRIAVGNELVPFKQEQLLFPSTYTELSDYSAKVPNDEQFWWGPYVTADVSGNGSSNGLWDDKLTGAIDKFVFVENTGKTDAYYRTIIAFECPEGMEYSQGPDKEFMMNVNLNNRFNWENIGYTTINDTRYLIYEATYNKILEPNTISRPSLLQVVMTHNATNEDMELLGETYEILVVSQAVQAEGFSDAKTALDEAFGETTVDNHPWIDNAPYINKPFYQSYDAPAEYTVDGKGKTISSYIVEDDIDWGEIGNKPNFANVFATSNGDTVTVKDLSFEGTMMPVMAGYYDGDCDFDTVFENVNIVGVESVGNAARFSCGLIIYGNATLNNCNVYGTTTKTEGTKLYDIVTQIGHTTINGGKIGNFYMANAGTTLTVNGAEVDSIYAAGRTAMIINIGSDSNIGTITLPTQATLTIEEGATVDTIICGGTTYTQAEWLAR